MATKSASKLKKSFLDDMVVYTYTTKHGTHFWSLRNQEKLGGPCVVIPSPHHWTMPAYILYPTWGQKWYGYSDFDVALERLIECERINVEFDACGEE